MMKVYSFTCGTRIYYIGSDEKYLVQQPGRRLTFFGRPENEEWEYIVEDITYQEWLEEQKVVDRGDYSSVLFKVVVNRSELEYEKGLRYKE